MNDINKLVNKFLDGETTLQEEAQLYRYFQRDDIPSELLPYKKAMLNFAAINGIDAQLIAQARKQPRKTKLVVWRWAAGIAASIAVAWGVMTFALPADDDICVAYEHGTKITDQRAVMANVDATMEDVFGSSLQPNPEKELKNIFLQ